MSQTQYTVRMASSHDIKGIQSLLNHYASMGDLLPRSRTDIEENLQHFRVIEDHTSESRDIIACGSLEYFSPSLAEVRSLMVSEHIKKGGLGRLIVEDLINEAKDKGVSRVMALTYVPGFFHKLGFVTVDKSIFPEKVWGICVNCYKFNNCDEIAVLLELPTT
jgi:amino-acid N-acetyltransferase